MTEKKNDTPITAADVKRYHDALALHAERRGRRGDFSTLDSEAYAREANDVDRRGVPGWAPPAAPKQWLIVECDPLCAGYREPNRRLLVFLSCAIENDGRAWLHLSVSHAARIPTWGELGIVKDAFLGDREAYQVMPPRSRYVNLHPHVLNVFALLEGEALPDFTRGTGGI